MYHYLIDFPCTMNFNFEKTSLNGFFAIRITLVLFVNDIMSSKLDEVFHSIGEAFLLNYRSFMHNTTIKLKRHV